MRIRVIYASQTGNTKKVALAIASALGVEAESVASAAAPIEAELLFLGGAVYATHDHGLRPELAAFVAALDPARTGKTALFCTGFEERAPGILRGLLARRGIRVAEPAFFCKGRFLLFNMGHPDAVDLEAAGDFARKTANDAGLGTKR
jgi:flavodoxin